MSAENYIKDKIEQFNFSEEFAEATLDLFDKMCILQWYGESFRLSVEQYLIARYYGYDAKIKYGLCTDSKNTVTSRSKNNVTYRHVWVEVGGIIIDLAIFGKVNFKPFEIGGHEYTYYPCIGKANYLKDPKTDSRFQYEECDIEKRWSHRGMIDDTKLTIYQFLKKEIKKENIYIEVESAIKPENRGQFLKEIDTIAKETNLSQFRIQQEY